MSPKAKPTKPLDIYVRVSQVGGREGESFISPKEQEEKCRALATMRGYEVGKVFTDLDQSGGTMDRPEFAKAMARIDVGTSGGLIVARLDRFARNVAGLLTEIDRIEAASGVWACAAPTIDTGDETYGRFLLTIFGAMAELELGKIKAAWKDAHRNHIERGVHSGRAPVGYDKVDGKLVPNEHADTVRAAFEMRCTTPPATYSEVAAFLTASGAPLRVRQAWNIEATRKLISNRTYLGEVRYGGLAKAGAHDAIITEDVFVLANRKVAAKATVRAGLARRDGHMLGGGLVRCGTCGGPLVTGTTRTKDGRAYPILRCNTGRWNGCTRGAAIQIGLLEPYLVSMALQRLGSQTIDAPVLEAADEAAVRAAEAGLAKLDELLQSGAVSEAEYDALAPARIAAVSAAKMPRDDGSVRAHFYAGPADEPTGFLILPDGSTVPRDTAAIFASAPVRLQRALLREMLGEVVVRTGRGTVEERVHIEATDAAGVQTTTTFPPAEIFPFPVEEEVAA
jgi:DNA invertase Pin-like site-specific DNA recombinase